MYKWNTCSFSGHPNFMGSNLIKSKKKMNGRFKNAFKMYIFGIFKSNFFWTFWVENFSELLGRKLFKVFDPQVRRFFNQRIREFSAPKSPKNFRPKKFEKFSTQKVLENFDPKSPKNFRPTKSEKNSKRSLKNFRPKKSEIFWPNKSEKF